MRFTHRLEEARDDARLAVRQLRAAPGFTLVAALTLALGVGVNSAIFALADAALMRPLPFGQVERLVMLGERTPAATQEGAGGSRSPAVPRSRLATAREPSSPQPTAATSRPSICRS